MGMDSYQKNILAFAEQLGPKGLTIKNFGALRLARPDALVVCGMGGSGLAGDIFQNLRFELGVTRPIIIWKNYGLPKLPAGIKKPLYVFVSYSGGTEETISGLVGLLKTQSLRIGARIAVITTGGKLKRLAEERGLPLVAFEAGTLTPRQAVGRMFYALAEVMHATHLITRRPPIFTRLVPRAFASAGKHLAAGLKNQLLAIYTSEASRHIGYLWKIKFNETAKVQAFANVLPEMDHNELTAFDTPPKVKAIKTAAIFLKDGAVTGRLAKKFRVTEKLIRQSGAHVVTLNLPGHSGLEKTWRSLILVDWASYFLGRANGIPDAEFNTVNTRIVGGLKKMMN